MNLKSFTPILLSITAAVLPADSDRASAATAGEGLRSGPAMASHGTALNGLNDDGLFTSIGDGPMFADSGPFETSFWVDYDNDGWLDLFLTGGNENNPSASGFENALYRNQGDGTFTRISEGSLLTATTHAGSQSWGDYDNDGWMDVFIAQWGNRAGVLLRNSGNGLFTPVETSQFILEGDGPLAVWSDFNNDGFLDLSHHGSGRNTILNGDSEGGFSSPLLLDTLGGWNRAAADYDNDGLVDLIINTAPAGRPILYRNVGNGSFQPVSSGDIEALAEGFVGLAWGDYDNDGFLDLYAARGPNGEGALFHNQRDGTMRRVLDPGEMVIEPHWNPHWVDYDNDGYLDLCVTGALDAPASIFRNSGDRTFAKLTTGSIATDVQADPYGSAWGDYDHNGFLDLFIPNQGGPHHLYRNNGNGNSWIQFKLVGTASNHAGIGAKVRVKAVIQGKELWQLRELIVSEGYNGHGTLRAEFGLGNAVTVETVRIEWPSGTVQEIRNLPTRQILTVTEPPRLSGARRNADGTVQFNLSGAVGVPFGVDISNDLVNWTPLLTNTNTARVEVISDKTTPGPIATRFYRATAPGPTAF